MNLKIGEMQKTIYLNKLIIELTLAICRKKLVE